MNPHVISGGKTMKKTIYLLILVLALLLSACGAKQNATEAPTAEETVPVGAATEPEIELDPEWLTEAAIDEAVSYLFPLEGQINVPMAQEILLPLLETGNAEAQYYWGYIHDFLLADNAGEGEKEALYWYKLSAAQGYAKAYLAAAVNGHLDSEEKSELIETAKQAGLFDLSPEELGPDGCDIVASYYLNDSDFPTAVEWYIKAAELGSTIGMIGYGQLLCFGVGVEQDYIAAADWSLKSAEGGNVDAMHFYGWMLTQYDISYALIDKHYTDSLDEYLKAADEGDPEAMYNIGVMYEFGYGGLEESDETALEWYRKAADAGSVEAMWYLTRNLWFFTYDLAGYSNYDEEYNYWCSKAAEAGHPNAMFVYGQILSDPIEAAEWYHKAAEAGNIDAMLMLGEIYYNGIGVEIDESIAIKWFDKYSEAYENLPIGNHIDSDTDMSKMVKVAMEWYKKAADNGHAAAMREIGYLSANFTELGIDGIGGSILYDEQFEWYMKAAEAGDSEAMFNLGDLYETGNDVVEQDYNEAMIWYIKAYANGYEPAAERITRLLENQQGVNAYFENYGNLLS